MKRLFIECRSKRHDCTAFLARKAWAIASWSTLTFFLYVRAFYDIYESLLIELVWMTLSLLLGFAQIFSWAQLSPLNKFEKMWSFGQILSTLFGGRTLDCFARVLRRKQKGTGKVKRSGRNSVLHRIGAKVDDHGRVSKWHAVILQISALARCDVRSGQRPQTQEAPNSSTAASKPM